MWLRTLASYFCKLSSNFMYSLSSTYPVFDSSSDFAFYGALPANFNTFSTITINSSFEE